MKFLDDDLMEMFRAGRGQGETSINPKLVKEKKEKISFKKTSKNIFMPKVVIEGGLDEILDAEEIEKQKYQEFKTRYDDLAHNIDHFSNSDLILFFAEKAKENKYSYVCMNKMKDLAIFKKLKKHYSNREICLMIEFLYNSDQTYLVKDGLSPNVLSSRWCNKIYADSMLWVDDKFFNEENNRSIADREWQREETESISIGEWS